MNFQWRMSNNAAGPSSKSKAGSSQPSETTFKRKRGVFQKECEYLETLLLCFIAIFFYVLILLLLGFTVQHMMYGFGDDPNVSSSTMYLFNDLGF
jgi:transcription initiation factor TFIID subunit 13